MVRWWPVAHKIPRLTRAPVTGDNDGRRVFSGSRLARAQQNPPTPQRSQANLDTPTKITALSLWNLSMDLAETTGTPLFDLRYPRWLVILVMLTVIVDPK